jgi:Zn-dependent M28 family amino/carboxypeptidase
MSPRVLPEPSADVRRLAERLAVHVGVLAGRIGPRHARQPATIAAAALYIEQQFLSHDFVVERQPFDTLGTTVANIEARIGAAMPRYFVVGAHYDTIPFTPGANDNASGVAVLLELARLFAGSKAAHVRFIAFVNEEPPWFQTDVMGSLIYAARARSRGDDITGMMALETMGYYSDAEGSQQYPPPFHWFFPSTGHFLAAVSNGRSFGLLRRFARAFRSASPLPLISTPAPARIPGVGWSDHWSFWQHGYRAMLLTDTAPYRYPHYHAASDTPDKLDYVRLAFATQGIAHAVRELTQSRE